MQKNYGLKKLAKSLNWVGRKSVLLYQYLIQIIGLLIFVSMIFYTNLKTSFVESLDTTKLLYSLSPTLKETRSYYLLANQILLLRANLVYRQSRLLAERGVLLKNSCQHSKE